MPEATEPGRARLLPEAAPAGFPGSHPEEEFAPVVGPPTSRWTTATNTARWVLLVLVIAFATYQVVHQWNSFSVALRSVNVLSLVVSFLFVLAGQAAGTLSWQTLLEDLGPPVGIRRASQVFLVGQLGKYVPGSVWAYLLQMELGRRYGIGRTRVFTAGMLAVGIAVVTSLGLGLAALPVLISGHRDVLWLYLLLPVGLACLHPRILSFLAALVFKAVRRNPLEHQLRKRVVARSALWSVLSYVCFGIHLWLLVNALVDPGFRALTICIGAMAVALTTGLFAFLLPSGIGVREVVLVAAMANFLSTPSATAMALLSRVLFIFADLTMAGGAAALASWRTAPSAPAAAAADPPRSW